MAVLYITEFAELQIGPAGRVGSVPEQPALAEQTVAIGGTSAASAALNAQTRFVRLHTDAVCSVLFGTSPTALANASGRLSAGQTEYRGVPKGASYKVAVIVTTI